MIGLGSLGLGGDPDRPTCSSAACRAAASWRVNWRNPRIHTADRVKVWLACDEHRSSLSDYLATRGFPVLVSALDEPVDAVPDAATSAGAGS
ncbi:hypothetical protein [Schumannella sp. 10F1B-5-1]|uniref:hypothetical protein n=1 Tax=Schumannella sp. 10F1B-5-1 TaxID=2590780 RepID=UPI001130B50A|nr:hypothetical protein [Schumannella sp. 10F1B-5-1]TPW70959.1 hypothetical protein FJ658_12730 [Schumannella sp. 10F1B-5-1]